MKEIKTPAYLCDYARFAHNALDLQKAIKELYPNYKLAYSYKTNSHPGFLAHANELGLMAEVVSLKEYKTAKSLGVEDENIIYNGVDGNINEKFKAAMSGALVNLDNVSQVREFDKLAREANTIIFVGVRFNFDIGNGMISRFGVEMNSDDYKWLLKQEYHKYVKVYAVHCHFTQARDLKSFTRRVNIAARIVKDFHAKILDIGGNMYGRMLPQFKSQFYGYVPTFDDYAEHIANAMNNNFPDQDVTLITENGTALVSDAMHLLTSIVNVKTMFGQTFIDVDAKASDVGAVSMTRVPTYKQYGSIRNYVEHAKVCGLTCYEGDVLISDYNGFASRGDKILILNVGAYSCSMANDFCEFKCSQFIDADGVLN